MKIRKGDTVQILSGKDKGKKGKVLQVNKEKHTVVVEGVNIVKRHVKPGVVSKEGGIISIEKPLNVSNVMYFDDKAKKPVRIGYKVENSKKVRISRATGKAL